MSDKIQVIDMQGASSGDVEISWLEREKGSQAVHDAVVAFLAGQRAGTACTKTRSEVSGTGKKPYKQKGTGRARAGSARSPIWRGGGITFGPKPRNYAKGINKKVKRLALRRAFTERFDAEEVIVVDDINFDAVKTKDAAAFLDRIGAGQRCLVVVFDEENFENLEKVDLSFGNLPQVDLVGSTSVNTYEMLLGKKVVITKKALEAIGERVTKEA